MFSTPEPLSPAAIHAVSVLTALSAAFAAKHFTADFLLQTNGMARGKERLTGWLTSLLAHVGCHAALALLILLAAAPRLWWLTFFDVFVHFAVDRSKSIIGHRTGWRPDQPEFWWLLGADQCLHQLTNIGLAAAVLLL